MERAYRCLGYWDNSLDRDPDGSVVNGNPSAGPSVYHRPDTGVECQQPTVGELSELGKIPVRHRPTQARKSDQHGYTLT